MPVVKEFEKVRQENTSSNVANVIGVKWICDGKNVYVSSQFGLQAAVSPSMEYVAILESLNPKQTETSLRTLRADGTLVAEVPNKVIINGKQTLGDWRWFEKSRVVNPHAVGVDFSYVWYDSAGLPNSPDQQVDIDASTGEILAVYKGR